MVALGVTAFNQDLTRSSITLPSPIQDALTTVIKDADAEWTLEGHTNLFIHGSLIGSNFKVIADGTSLATALLVVDFSEKTSCNSHHTVILTAGTISIDSIEAVQYGEAYSDIQLVMSSCDDMVHVESTYESASSIEIVGTAGNNTIELGVDESPFEEQIHCNIIVDGGKGSNDVLKIHDSSSSMLKPDLAMRPTLISGIHNSTNHSISLFNIEHVEFELGTSPANFTVYSTAKNTSVTVTTQMSNDTLRIENGK